MYIRVESVLDLNNLLSEASTVIQQIHKSHSNEAINIQN